MNSMSKRQKMLVLIVASLLALGLAAYGAISLMAKVDQAKELNEQLAEAEDPESKPDPESATTPGGDGKEGEAGAGDEIRDPAEEPRSSQVPTEPTDIEPNDLSVEQTAKPSHAAEAETAKPSARPTATTPAPVDKTERKEQIDSAVTVAMESLRATCKAKSSGLVAQIKAEIASDQDAAVGTIQKEFLGQIIAAEADCDSQFAQLVGQAKEQYEDAGIAESELPNWSTEYDNAKAEARAAALTEIASAIQ